MSTTRQSSDGNSGRQRSTASAGSSSNYVRGKTINIAQREIITEGWHDYINCRLSVTDIAAAAGVGYETTRAILAEITKAKRVKPPSQRQIGQRRSRADMAEKSSIRPPRGVTAQPFTEEWWEQNQLSAAKHFKACISAGHWQFFSAE